jgi:hypothetical protein
MRCGWAGDGAAGPGQNCSVMRNSAPFAASSGSRILTQGKRFGAILASDQNHHHRHKSHKSPNHCDHTALLKQSHKESCPVPKDGIQSRKRSTLVHLCESSRENTMCSFAAAELLPGTELALRLRGRTAPAGTPRLQPVDSLWIEWGFFSDTTSVTPPPAVSAPREKRGCGFPPAWCHRLPKSHPKTCRKIRLRLPDHRTAGGRRDR